MATLYVIPSNAPTAGMGGTPAWNAANYAQADMWCKANNLSGGTAGQRLWAYYTYAPGSPPADWIAPQTDMFGFNQISGGTQQDINKGSPIQITPQPPPTYKDPPKPDPVKPVTPVVTIQQDYLYGTLDPSTFPLVFGGMALLTAGVIKWSGNRGVRGRKRGAKRHRK